MVLKVLAGTLSIGAAILMPWVSHGFGILLGFPVTAILKRIPVIPKSLEFDVQFISLTSTVIEGFLCVIVGLFAHMVLNVIMIEKLLFVFIGQKIIFSIWRHSQGKLKPTDFINEVILLMAYSFGIYFGGKYFL